MGEQILFVERGRPRPGVVPLCGSFTIGAAGAVSAQDGFSKAGFSVTKNAAAGRYDILFYKPFRVLQKANVNILGPASAAFPTTTGSDPQLRPGNGPTAATINLQVQFKRTDTQADADAASGTICYLDIEVSDIVTP